MEYTQPTEKRCSKCKEVKALGAFGVNKSAKSGYDFACRACNAARAAARRKTHGQEISEQRKQHRAARPEVFAARNRANYQANRARIVAEKRAHRAAHPEQYAAMRRERGKDGRSVAYVQARNARKRQAVPGWVDDASVQRVYAKAKHLTEVLGVDMQVDHVVPLRSPLVCGLHCPDNLQLLEAGLNRSKGNHHWPDMP